MTGPAKKLLIFLGAITLFRVFYINLFELIPDEAYYWTWATALDWCYYDQPSGIAAADLFFTSIFGTTTWGLRMGAVILGLVGSLFAWLTARKLGWSESESAWTVVMIHTLPLMSAGHVLMLHDTVMMAAASALLYFLVRGIFDGGWLPWIVAGVLAVLVWNSKNEWIAALAVRKLGSDPDSTFLSRFINIFDFIGSQAALVSPIIFVLMCIASWAAIKKIKSEDREKESFVACLFIGVMVYFLLQALRANVQGNLAAMAYLPGALLLARYYGIRARQGKQGFVKWTRWGYGLALLITLVFTIQPVFKLIPLPDGKDMTDQVYGWEELAARVDEVREKHPNAVLAARRYQVASQLMFYCKGNPEIFVANWSSRGNQWDIWNNWPSLAGKTLLYVDVQGRSGKLWRHFQDHEALPDFIRERRGHPVQPVHMTLLKGFSMDGPLKGYFSAPLKYSADKMRNRHSKNKD